MCKTMSRGEHDRLPSIAQACADDGEVLGLSILRFVASGYMTGDVACFEAAHNGAEQLLGAVEGARLVATMTTLMRAIRAERRTEWRFMPAICCRVTPDERDLIGLISAVRQAGRPDDGAAAIFAGAEEGEGAPRLTAALAAAAAAIDWVRPMLGKHLAGQGAPARSVATASVLH